MEKQIQEKKVRVRWCNDVEVEENWGDKLNPEIVAHLSQREVSDWAKPGRMHALASRAYFKATRRHLVFPVTKWRRPVYLVIGSGLVNADNNTIVWGQGFGYATEQLRHKPRRICAVRGPLSRKRLLEGGFDCPDVIGDPAILYPLIYRPTVPASVDLGIIRHIHDVGFDSPRFDPGVSTKLIDIKMPLQKFVDEILSCRQILSTSLHGLIAAHAYGIPAGWFRFTNRARSDSFKFHDYWSSVGMPEVAAEEVAAGAHAMNLLATPLMPALVPSASDLLRACPFLADGHAEDLISRCHLIYKRPSDHDHS